MQDRNGDTPLHLAVRYGSEKLALILLKLTMIDVDIENSNGSSALHTAAANGPVEVVRSMLGCKAKLNYTNKEGTPCV